MTTAKQNDTFNNMRTHLKHKVKVYKQFGRVIKSLVFYSIEDVNHFIKSNEDWGLLLADDDKSLYYVALKDDKGLKIKNDD